MDMRELMASEMKIINGMFKRNDILAKVDLKQVVVVEVGYISYGLKLAPTERLAHIESIQRELSARLATNRRRLGLTLPNNIEFNAIVTSTPRLSVEVPHPSPKILLWPMKRMLHGTPRHSMLIGRSYLDGPRDEYVKFDDAPHILVCGITNAGKSVLLQTMLLSLCAGTSPTELELVLVDLKNEDLVPFARLPHVGRFATTREAALEAIQYVRDEKDRRITGESDKSRRIVLVIDEMAQLAAIREAKDTLGDIASIGRSKNINLIGATQQPTEKGGMGSLMKANFVMRLVGMVAPGQSHIATGRANTHADLLPGRGAFLKCFGMAVHRFQSFYIDINDVNLAVNYISTKLWGDYCDESQRVVMNHGPVVMSPVITTVPTVTEEAKTHTFPIGYGRPLTDDEKRCVCELAKRGEFQHNGSPSVNKLTHHVYGSKNPERMAWIREALEVSDEKVTA